MGGSTFGTLFRVTTFGESHGPALGAVIDGCPAGISLEPSDIQKELNRRRPGYHPGDGMAAEGLNPAVTSRTENDECEILSGVFEGVTTGAPIAVLIRNTSQRSGDYGTISRLFRPGHADYTWQAKYGIRDYRGGGRSSGRETAARTAAGAIAKKILENAGIRVYAYTIEAAGIACSIFDASVIELNRMRAPDMDAAERMSAKIAELKQRQDSAGGIVECIAAGLPPGLGEPVFDKLDAELAKAALSIGAVKGIEFGAGFRSAAMTGSEWNDVMRKNGSAAGAQPGSSETRSPRAAVSFETNHSGGVLGGISSGADVVFRVAVKPVPSISRIQHTIDVNGENSDILIEGRHDVCLCPRIVPVLESMTAITLADFLLRDKSSRL